MKSHTTRYSPKYFADFADAFKPVAKVGTKLKGLAQQALKGMTKTNLSAQQKSNLKKLMVHDPIDGEGTQWFDVNKKDCWQSFNRIDPLSKLIALTNECAKADDDCRLSAEDSGAEVYSCSDAYDEYRGKLKPRFPPLEQHAYCAEQAFHLYQSVLETGTPKERRQAREVYTMVMEWIEDLPVTNKPDHIYLSSNEGGKSSGLRTETTENSKNHSESTQ